MPLGGMRVPEEMNIVADALGGMAIVAKTVLLAGSVDVETGGIDGGGGATSTLEGGIHVLGYFVEADEGRRLHPVQPC